MAQRQLSLGRLLAAEDHLAVKHFCFEGHPEVRALLFVPRQAPFDMYGSTKRRTNIKLHVRRFFIMDDFDEFLPAWFQCLQGVVDSEDLLVNFPRELLQQNKLLGVIKKTLVHKSLEMLEEIAEKKR